MPTHPVARSLRSPSPPVTRLLRGLVAVLVLTLLWDLSGLDLPVLRAIGTPEGLEQFSDELLIIVHSYTI